MASKHTIRILFHFIFVIAVSLDDTATKVMGDCADDNFGNCSSSTEQQSISQFESTSTDINPYVIDTNVTAGTPVSNVNITLIEDIVNTSSTTEQMFDATSESTFPVATTKLPEPQSGVDEVARDIPEDVCMCDLQVKLV